MWGSWNLFLFFFIFVCCCCGYFFFFLFLFILVFIISAFLYGSGCSYCCVSGLLFTKDIKSEGKWASVAWKWRDYVKWRGSAGVDVDNLIIDDDVEVAHLLLSIPYIFFLLFLLRFYGILRWFFKVGVDSVLPFEGGSNELEMGSTKNRTASMRFFSNFQFTCYKVQRIPQESLKDPRSLSIMKVWGHRGPNPLIGTSMID